MTSQRWIYLIEEDPKILSRIKATFYDHFPGYKLLEFNRYTDAKHSAEERRPDIVILSLEIQEKMGPFNFIEWLKSHSKGLALEIIALGTRNTLEKVESSLESSSVAVVPKPIRIPLLYEVIEEQVKRIEKDSNQVVNLAAGDHLFNEGDQSDCVYVLRKGKLRVYHKEGEKQITLKTIEPPELIGELAVIDNAKRSASVVASEDSRLMKLEIGDIDAYLAEQPFWVRLFFKTLADRLREANKKIVDLSF